MIISVPYRWPKGKCAPHLQDPVDEAKLRSWVGRDWTEGCIADDGMKRFVAVYEGDGERGLPA